MIARQYEDNNLSHRGVETIRLWARGDMLSSHGHMDNLFASKCTAQCAAVLAKKRDETVGWAFIRYFDQIASSFFPFARLWTMALQRVAAGATANVEDKMKRIVDVNRMGRFFAAKTEDIRKAQGVFFTHRY